MHLPFFPTAAAALFLVSVAQGSQHPLEFGLPGDICGTSQKDNLLVLSQLRAPQLCPTPPMKSGPANLWTEQVKCIPEANNTETYCVYTNSEFANGRGISFFTTPSVAAKVASLPAFTQPSLYDNVNNFSSVPWEVRYTPGRGNGLFATHTLYRGDPILAATPVGVYHSSALKHDFPLGYRYLHTAFIHLPPPSQQLFLSTAAVAEGDPFMERINRNAFAGAFEGASHFLMYPETARMNHDCRPNAMYYYDPKTLIHSTQASRMIYPGEEITIPYINILQSKQDRQEALSNYWGFKCSCSLCSSSTEHAHASDSRVQRIVHLQNALADWSSGSMGSPSTAETLIELYEEEGVHAAEGTGHMFAALAYNAVGDAEKAREHAEDALRAGVVNDGGGLGDESEMRSLLEWAEGHWSFMSRRR